MALIAVSMTSEQADVVIELASEHYEGNVSALIRAALGNQYQIFRETPNKGSKKRNRKQTEAKHAEFLKDKQINGFTLTMAQRPDGT